jgi:DsbC/DsbD-like thiol-disulfide interchange protein
MWFRSIIAGAACSLLASAAFAAEKPYRVSLVGDSFDGQSWHTGVLVELDPGWKTYWRMPGEAGIPPEFTWTTSAPAAVNVAFPMPGRYADQSGETVGYETAVLFPATVTPEKPGPLELGVDMFFAVCKDICIPASARATITLGTAMQDPDGSARVEDALKALPASGDAVVSAVVEMGGGMPVLRLGLRDRPDDIFVETATSAYFRRPVFSADGSQASLTIDNLKDPAKLAGTSLKLTYRLNGAGLEQIVTLP